MRLRYCVLAHAGRGAGSGARLRVLSTDPVFLCGLCNRCRISHRDAIRLAFPDQKPSIPAEMGGQPGL